MTRSDGAFTAPPEAELIERARKQLPKGESSVSRASKEAGISEGRWRQIAKGYQQATKDTRLAVIAPADTLARMARAVGVTEEQLRAAGREDAADELGKLINWKKHVRPGFGTDSLKWRAELAHKPLAEWTLEDHEFMHALRVQRDQAAVDDVAKDDNWMPADEPASRQPSWSPYRSRSFEELFNEWQVARARLLNIELEYAIGRKIRSEDAPRELADVLQMIIDSRDGTGRPWTPPWDPGPEFLPGEEPWRLEWWMTAEEVPAPEGLPGTVTRVGFGGWDVQRVRAYHAAQGDEWAPKTGEGVDERSTDPPRFDVAWPSAPVIVDTGDRRLHPVQERQSSDEPESGRAGLRRHRDAIKGKVNSVDDSSQEGS